MIADRSMIFLIFLIVATTIAATCAFTVVPSSFAGVKRCTSVARSSTSPLYVSDETTSSEADATPELLPEEEAARSKRKIARERHTLFVGNLPFGTSVTV